MTAAPSPSSSGTMDAYTDSQIADRMQQTYDVTGDRWFKIAADRLRSSPTPQIAGGADLLATMAPGWLVPALDKAAERDAAQGQSDCGEKKPPKQIAYEVMSTHSIDSIQDGIAEAIEKERACTAQGQSGCGEEDIAIALFVARNHGLTNILPWDDIEHDGRDYWRAVARGLMRTHQVSQASSTPAQPWPIRGAMPGWDTARTDAVECNPFANEPAAVLPTDRYAVDDPWSRPPAALPAIVDRDELIALLQDLASVNLSREAVERQARRMADDLIARGLSLPSTGGGTAA